MPLEERIRRIAIAEAVNQPCALTKQYLTANKLLFEDGEPAVEDIIIDEDGTRAQVYFPVLDENYYFVVYIDIDDDKISIRSMSISAGNRVRLVVESEEKSLPELLQHLDITPTDQWEKGQPVRANSRILRKSSGFTYALTTQKAGEVEDKLNALVDFLTPLREQMLRLAQIATTEISVAYYGYKDEMWGIHLDADILSAIAQLGLSVDIDLYAGGPDL